MLVLKLKRLNENQVRGTYGPNKNELPERMRYLHPDAAEAYASVSAYGAAPVAVSDMFRSPESSLEAVRAGRGALPPGYSAHNYGLAIDIDIASTMKLVSAKTKKELDLFMARYGWYCHRTDHSMVSKERYTSGPKKGKLRPSEAWHYNYLGPLSGFPGRHVTAWPGTRTTVNWIAGRIDMLYGAMFNLTFVDAQTCLAKLHLYHGDIDGLFGKLSAAALRMFQNSMDLNPTGALDPKTMRTLAYAACEKELV